MFRMFWQCSPQPLIYNIGLRLSYLMQYAYIYYLPILIFIDWRFFSFVFEVILFLQLFCYLDIHLTNMPLSTSFQDTIQKDVIRPSNHLLVFEQH